MGQATQVLPTAELSSRIVIVVGHGTTLIVSVPLLGYPALIQYFRASPASVGATSGTYTIIYYPNPISAPFYIQDAANELGPTPYNQVGFYNFSPPVQTGIYYMEIDGEFIFSNQVPVAGTVALSTENQISGDPLFPVMAVGIRNDSDGDITFTLDVGYSLTGRGLDISPDFFPGMVSNVISSSNI